MRLFVNVFELFNRIMGIYLRCRKATMAKEFLYSVQVGAFVGKMRGKTVPQNMWALFIERFHLTGQKRSYQQIRVLRIHFFALFSHQ